MGAEVEDRVRPEDALEVGVVRCEPVVRRRGPAPKGFYLVWLHKLTDLYRTTSMRLPS